MPARSIHDAVTPLLAPLLAACLLILPHALFAAPPKEPMLRIRSEMHTASITDMSVDRSGTLLLTASLDKTARLWNAKDGRLLTILSPPVGKEHDGKLSAAALSPDGRLAACAGHTGPEWDGNRVSIYLFDTAGGRMLGRIAGLPNAVRALRFSPDGRLLAVGIGSDFFSPSLLIYRIARERDAVSATLYGEGRSSGTEDGYTLGDVLEVDFSADGKRLVTASYDGFVRIFSMLPLLSPVPPRETELKPMVEARIPGGFKPSSVRFSPDGSRIAVGFADVGTKRGSGDAPPRESIRIAVVSAATLKVLFLPDVTGVPDDLSNTAWSADGKRLYGAGTFSIRMRSHIRRWDNGGKGPYRDIPAADRPVTALATLPGGGIAFGSDASLGMVDRQGRRDLTRQPELADFVGDNRFMLSEDGDRVRFSYRQMGRSSAIFSVSGRALSPTRESRPAGMSPPPFRTKELRVRFTTGGPVASVYVNDRIFNLPTFEMPTSRVIAPDSRSFVLGTSTSLIRFSADGAEIWRTPLSSMVLSLNVSRNGRLAVAGLRDGTIRWFGMGDGRELLALYPHADKSRWVMWTPEGYFDASPGAEGLVGYHLNQGGDREGRFIPLNSLYDAFYRPDIVQARFRGDDTSGLITLTAEQALASPPPIVSLTGRPVEQADGKARICYRATSAGGGIGEVRLFQNGKLVRSDGFYREAAQRPDAGGVSMARLDGAAVHRELRALVARDKASPLPATRLPKGELFEECVELDPAPGDNELAVAVFNAANTVQGSLITASFRSKRPAAEARLHILAIGIDTFRDPAAALRFAARDARDFSGALAGRAKGLFRPENIRVRLLTHREAGRAGIMDAVAKIAQEARQEDTFVLFAASHGLLNRNQYQLVTADYSGDLSAAQALIGANELVDISKRVKALHQLFVFDTCHAGGVDTIVSGLYDARMSTLAKRMGLQVFASASSQQAALDGYLGNGLFTHALLEAIRETRGGDTVTAAELGQRARGRTSEISTRLGRPQTPLIITIGREIPLYRTGQSR